MKMEYPAEIVVKEEPVYEYQENGEVLEIAFDVDVKVEDCASFTENWRANKPEELRKSSEEERFECQLCHRQFVNCHSLFKHNIQHLKVVVDKCTIFRCNSCTMCFIKIEEFITHMREHESSEKLTAGPGVHVTKVKHKCAICGKVLPYKSWHEHMRQVHTENRIDCPKCGKKFKCSRNLFRHNKYIHEGVEAPWRSAAYKSSGTVYCKMCDKSFTNKFSLNTHIKNCHSDRMYQCYMCSSTLKSKSYLMAHVRRVHYFDGKEHSCDVCGKKFKSPRYMRIHKRNMHCNKLVDITIKMEEVDAD